MVDEDKIKKKYSLYLNALVEVMAIIQFTAEILHFTNKTFHRYFRH
jgi:hypothetical protein